VLGDFGQRGEVKGVLAFGDEAAVDVAEDQVEAAEWEGAGQGRGPWWR
jgi:hypothetical protein